MAVMEMEWNPTMCVATVIRIMNNNNNNTEWTGNKIRLGFRLHKISLYAIRRRNCWMLMAVNTERQPTIFASPLTTCFRVFLWQLLWQVYDEFRPQVK